MKPVNQLDARFHLDSIDWLTGIVDNMIDHIKAISPSEWAEENRYLTKSVSPIAGFYDYAITPYLKEIVDCFDIRSPIREVSVMKGVQIGATVGILENIIGYLIAVVKSAPAIMVTADDGLAKIRMEKNITPMIQESGLEHLIQSIDKGNSRKLGKTDKGMEWIGGGWALPFGAQNADKMRSISVMFALLDENDGYPETVGVDGDPQELIESRTSAYSQQRKIGRFSTPLFAGTSRIEQNFEDGDQRYFEVPCKDCGEFQVLRFSGKNDDGESYGLVYQLTDKGFLIPDTTRYKCKFCGHLHINADKTFMLTRGEWVPTATPKMPNIRSYHISALMSPAAFFTWESCVQKWLDAWDIANKQPKNLAKLQVFYNNILGMPYEMRGEKLTFGVVSEHRRHAYIMGEIPNEHSVMYGEGKIGIITCTVDVQDDDLAVLVEGFARGNRSYVISYTRFVGNCKDPLDPTTWGQLTKLIEEGSWTDNDGRKYKVNITIIDAGHMYDLVCTYCGQWSEGVYPSLGRGTSQTKMTKEFTELETRVGTKGYNIAVDVYKDRMSSALRKSWDGESQQPHGHFNVPYDITNDQLKELTVEFKRERIHAKTRQRLGWEWHRPSGSKNELWDTHGYALCALDIFAHDLCIKEYERLSVNWTDFWDYVEENTKLYYIDPPAKV